MGCAMLAGPKSGRVTHRSAKQFNYVARTSRLSWAPEAGRGAPARSCPPPSVPAPKLAALHSRSPTNAKSGRSAHPLCHLLLPGAHGREAVPGGSQTPPLPFPPRAPHRPAQVIGCPGHGRECCPCRCVQRQPPAALNSPTPTPLGCRPLPRLSARRATTLSKPPR